MNSNKIIVSFNLSGDTVESLESFARSVNVFKTDVVEFAIRDFLGLNIEGSKRILINHKNKQILNIGVAAANEQIKL